MTTVSGTNDLGVRYTLETPDDMDLDRFQIALESIEQVRPKQTMSHISAATVVLPGWIEARRRRLFAPIKKKKVRRIKQLSVQDYKDAFRRGELGESELRHFMLARNYYPGTIDRELALLRGVQSA